MAVCVVPQPFWVSANMRSDWLRLGEGSQGLSSCSRTTYVEIPS